MTSFDFIGYVFFSLGMIALGVNYYVYRKWRTLEADVMKVQNDYYNIMIKHELGADGVDENELH